MLMGQAQFSVVIPTLQRAAELEPLVMMCSEHPLVSEILVINNAPQPISFAYPKLRVLEQRENIYVNPAWNLGASIARSPLLAILNDDVSFDAELFDLAALQLRRKWVGIVGVDGAFINQPRLDAPRVRLATYGHVTLGFGMAMFMRQDDYVPIPSSLKIWGGDDWLFMQQKYPNLVIAGVRFDTEMSVTSGSHEFSGMRMAERDETGRLLNAVLGKRWWHWPTGRLAAFRSWRGRHLRRG